MSDIKEVLAGDHDLAGLAHELWAMAQGRPIEDAVTAITERLGLDMLAAVAAEHQAIIDLLPGGDSVDPQWLADQIRARLDTRRTAQLPAPAAGEREAFEAWLMSLGAAQGGATLQKLGAEYLDGRTRSAWQAWQARAAAQGDGNG
jgi:hypothetical protein